MQDTERIEESKADDIVIVRRSDLQALFAQHFEQIAELVSAQPKPELVNSATLCTLLGVSKSTLSRLVADGLPHIMVGAERRYRPAAVYSWLEQQTEATR